MAGLSKPELTPPKELAWRGSSPEDNTAKSCWGCFGDPPPSDRLPQNQAVWDAKLLLPHKSCLSVYDMVAGFPWRARRNYNSFYELVSKVTRHHFWFILCAASESLSPTYAREEELSFSSWREQNQRIWGHTLNYHRAALDEASSWKRVDPECKGRVFGTVNQQTKKKALTTCEWGGRRLISDKAAASSSKKRQAADGEGSESPEGGGAFRWRLCRASRTMVDEAWRLVWPRRASIVCVTNTEEYSDLHSALHQLNETQRGERKKCANFILIPINSTHWSRQWASGSMTVPRSSKGQHKILVKVMEGHAIGLAEKYIWVFSKHLTEKLQ